MSGEIKQNEREEILRQQARKTGEFAYRVTLPGQIDQQHIEANLENSVLIVRMPRTETTKLRQIEVKAAQA